MNVDTSTVFPFELCSFTILNLAYPLIFPVAVQINPWKGILLFLLCLEFETQSDIQQYLFDSNIFLCVPILGHFVLAYLLPPSLLNLVTLVASPHESSFKWSIVSTIISFHLATIDWFLAWGVECALLLELRFLARSTRRCACERTLLLGLLTMFRWQYEGPDLILLTYNLSNSETTCSERSFLADYKSEEFCNEYFCNASKKKKEKKKKRKYISYMSTLFQPKRVWLMWNSVIAKYECKMLCFLFLFCFLNNVLLMLIRNQIQWIFKRYKHSLRRVSEIKFPI